jgi:hypothetical protein
MRLKNMNKPVNFPRIKKVIKDQLDREARIIRAEWKGEKIIVEFEATEEDLYFKSTAARAPVFERNRYYIELGNKDEIIKFDKIEGIIEAEEE